MLSDLSKLSLSQSKIKSSDLTLEIKKVNRLINLTDEVNFQCLIFRKIKILEIEESEKEKLIGRDLKRPTNL